MCKHLRQLPIYSGSPIVDNHVVEGDTGVLVFLSNFSAGVEEEAISKLHDVL